MVSASSSVEKRKLHKLQPPGDDVLDTGAGVDVRDLECGRREMFVANVPARLGQFGKRRRQTVDGIAGEMGIGNVTLGALDVQFSTQGAPSSDLYRVAEKLVT